MEQFLTPRLHVRNLVVNPMQLTKPAFTIVVSEKGGAERRESFAATEIGIGRVQGNDLVLAKGNVSKQHAKLLYEDGQFVVQDAGSTNGTYVNRRRIQQPTVVGEGDRIYIGDFILRLEREASVASSAADEAPVQALPVEPGEPRAAPIPPSAEPTQSRARPGIDAMAEQPAYPVVPGAPRVPLVARTSQAWNETGKMLAAVGDTVGLTRPALADSSASIAAEEGATLAPEDIDTLGVLAMVVDAVTDQLGDWSIGGSGDAERRDTVEQALDFQVRRLAQGPGFPRAAGMDQIRQLARAELLELGPIGALLDDPSVTEIVSSRHEQTLVRRGGELSPEGLGFSSARSLIRSISRLCSRAGRPIGPNEHLVERRLSSNATLCAVLPPLARQEASLVIRRRHETVVTLEGLVRAGTISRAISSFLHQAISARLRILVTGVREADTGPIVGALSSVVTDSPLVVLEGVGDFGIPNPSCAVMNWSLLSAADGASLVRTAVRTATSQFLVALESPEVSCWVVEALGCVGVGVIAAREARTAELALGRMVADLMAVRPGLGVDAARRMLSGCFDLVLEVVRFQDGRQRVVRIGEVGRFAREEIEIDDIFNFVTTPTGSSDVVEGTFRSSGGTPRVVKELMDRGLPFDLNVFSRSQSR